MKHNLSYSTIKIIYKHFNIKQIVEEYIEIIEDGGENLYPFILTGKFTKKDIVKYIIETRNGLFNIIIMIGNYENHLSDSEYDKIFNELNYLYDLKEY